MNIIENKVFDEERAFYNSRDISIRNCEIDGPADGESAFKECLNTEAVACRFNLRYPFWHCDTLRISGSRMTELCRAALWYSKDISISDTQLYGIKALRECGNTEISDCDIASPEFGWFCDGINMYNSTVKSEYFMLRSRNIQLENVKLSGKYSFQYIENAVFENCTFDTKDAFWHGKSITLRNCVVKGEYLAWYSENITFEDCTIIGTQPLCYCKGLKLINCKMLDCDLAFEKSEVEATITSPVISVKNIKSGRIYAPEIGEIICDDENAKGEIFTGCDRNVC